MGCDVLVLESQIKPSTQQRRFASAQSECSPSWKIHFECENQFSNKATERRVFLGHVMTEATKSLQKKKHAARLLESRRYISM